MLYLKQSTAVTLLFGPFLDDTDGKTAETALTVSQADVRLSKNGGNMAQKNEATSFTHDELGYYTCLLDVTDTNTLGVLKVMVHETGALPVWMDCMVVTANVWDTLCSTDQLDVNVTNVAGTAQTGNDNGADINAILLDTGTNGVIIADGHLTAAKFGADCITAAKIADDAFVAANFATGAFTADAFAADALVAATFATGCITADAIAANAIVAAALNADCITAAKIAPDAIESNMLATGALTADAFAADAIVAATLATDSITSDAFAASAASKIFDSLEGITGDTHSFEKMITTIFMFLFHEMNITDATGAMQVRNSGDSGNVVTATITDDDTTTNRTKAVIA